MNRFFAFASALCLTIVLVGQASANGLVPSAGNARFNVKVKSLVDLRFKKVVRQKYDLSCGAAAMATLMKYFYDDNIGEQKIIDGIMEFGDKEKINQDGFSMLELKKFGERSGYIAKGYRISDARHLSRIKVPVLTLTNTRGYNHFVVIKGIKDGQVFIADPAFGNRSQRLEVFEEEWNNVVLVFFSPTNKGNNNFTLDPMLKAPKEQVKWLLDQGLFHIRPGAGEF